MGASAPFLASGSNLGNRMTNLEPPQPEDTHVRSNSGTPFLTGRLGFIFFIFLYFGTAKFKSDADAPWVVLFDQIGFGQWLRYFTGVLEIVGAFLVLVSGTVEIGLAILIVTGAERWRRSCSSCIGHPTLSSLSHLYGEWSASGFTAAVSDRDFQGRSSLVASRDRPAPFLRWPHVAYSDVPQERPPHTIVSHAVDSSPHSVPATRRLSRAVVPACVHDRHRPPSAASRGSSRLCPTPTPKNAGFCCISLRATSASQRSPARPLLTVRQESRHWSQSPAQNRAQRTRRRGHHDCTHTAHRREP